MPTHSDPDAQPPLDFDALRAEADAKMPVAAVFAHFGMVIEHPTRWGKCPACGTSGKFKLLGANSFKCFQPECELNPDQLAARGLRATAAGLIGLKQGVDWKEAGNLHLLWSGAIDQDTYERLSGRGSRIEDRGSQKKASRRQEKARAAAAAAETGSGGDGERGRRGDLETGGSGGDGEKISFRQFQEAADADEIPGLTPTPSLQVSESPSLPDSEPSGNAWGDLWAMMTLGDGDRTDLMTRRGFSRETIEQIGKLRSSRESNADHIRALAAKYDPEDLVEWGLMTEEMGQSPRPDAQLCGWGFSKEKGPDGKRKLEKNFPILIPYFNHLDQVVTIRPHKGGLKKRILPGDIGATNYSMPYGEHLIRRDGIRGKGWCVLTEGELKALAVSQCGIPCLSVPGITFINNPEFREKLREILRRNHIHEVVVIFDNEDKSHKPEEDRYNVVIYANVTAHHLREMGMKARVGQLPDECRIHGKADFDSILAQEVMRAEGNVAKGTAAAKRIFEAVIAKARASDTNHAFINELFPSRAQQIINSRTLRYTRKRVMAIGDETEKETARLLRFKNSGLSHALRETVGCYYIRKEPDKDRRKELRDLRSRVIEQIKQMEENKAKPKEIREQRLTLLELDEQLKGWPENISNFSLTCHYRVKAEDTGALNYYCEAWMPNERRRELAMFPAKTTRLAEMGEFVKGHIGATFFGGAKDLQSVWRDLDTDSAWRTVNEVNAYGHHEMSDLFIFGDVAWDSKGQRVFPDKDRIFWHNDSGYQIDPIADRVGDGFQQKAPLMLPHEEDRPDLPALTEQWVRDTGDAIGGLEGWMLIGAAVAYLAMPAFFKHHGVQHPGIWLHGTFGDGKTYTARKLMRLHGFRHVRGIVMGPTTTDVALNRALAQYSCLLVFLDEYRAAEATDSRNGTLRASFDRSDSAKGTIENRRRTRATTPSTTPLVCGESECGDSATRSRFVQAVISKARRKPDPDQVQFRRLEAADDWLYQVGRRLLDRRPDFEQSFLSHYQYWRGAIDVKTKADSNDRSILSHGVAYAGMAALAEILDLRGIQREILSELLPFLVKYMKRSDADTKSTGIIERFWDQIIPMYHQGKISKETLRRRWVKPHPKGKGMWVKATRHEADSREILQMNIAEAFPSFLEALNKMRVEFPISQSNLGKYLKNQPYWVWKADGKGWSTRWGKALRPTWAVFLDGENPFPWGDQLGGVLPDITELIEEDEDPDDGAGDED